MMYDLLNMEMKPPEVFVKVLSFYLVTDNWVGFAKHL